MRKWIIGDSRRLAYLANPLGFWRKWTNFPTPPGTALSNEAENISWFGLVLLFWRSQKLKKLDAILLTSHTGNLLALLKNRVYRVGISSHMVWAGRLVYMINLRDSLGTFFMLITAVTYQNRYDLARIMTLSFRWTRRFSLKTRRFQDGSLSCFISEKCRFWQLFDDVSKIIFNLFF